MRAPRRTWAQVKPRTCEVCGGEIPRYLGEKPFEYEKRSVCSRVCAGKRTAALKARRNKPPAKPRTVAEFLASGGRITLCPTKYVAPCQNAIEGAEAARRLASMAAVDHKADSWKGRKSA